MVRVTLGAPIEDSIELIVDGEARDPGAITLRYRLTRDPESEVIVQVPDPQNPPSPIERTGVGAYRAVLTLPEVGNWRIRWESTAPAESASEIEVNVRSIYPA